MLGYAGPTETAGWAAIVAGIGVLLFSFEDLVMPSQIEEWVELVLGVVLMAMPWLWGYSDNLTATLNSVIPGFLISGTAVWALKHLGFAGIKSAGTQEPKPH